MLIGVDHVVVLTPNLDTAIDDWRQQGFTVVPGGRHPTGTHNALIGFADGSYVELLSFYEPTPHSKWWPKLEWGGGLIAACLQTDDLRSELAAFRKAGIRMSNPQPLSRVRPDGYRLKWSLSFHEGGNPDAVPFLIEDETPRDERVPREIEHRNKVTGIDSVTFVVKDLQSLWRQYSIVLGHAGDAIECNDIAASGVQFAIGRHRLNVVTPTRTEGSSRKWLVTRGESPFSLELATPSGEVFKPLLTTSECPVPLIQCSRA